MHKFHSTHSWARLENGEAVIGLSFYAQAHLGNIVYVDLPPASGRVTAGQPLGGIESAKTTSEVTSPVTGRVAASNPELASRPELINTNPMDAGWITRVILDDPAEMDGLMDRAAYEAYLTGIEDSGD